MKTLVLDSTLRESSLTKKLLHMSLLYLKGRGLGDFETRHLSKEKDHLLPLDEETLLKRSRLIKEGDFSDPLFLEAKVLREASRIIVAAPFFDLSIPALLRSYIEQTMIDTLTFKDLGDHAEGLLPASSLLFLYVSGYPLGGSNPDLALPYIEGIAHMWGIKKVYSYHLTAAEAESLNDLPDSLKKVLDAYLEEH